MIGSIILLVIEEEWQSKDAIPSNLFRFLINLNWEELVNSLLSSIYSMNHEENILLQWTLYALYTLHWWLKVEDKFAENFTFFYWSIENNRGGWLCSVNTKKKITLFSDMLILKTNILIIYNM